MNQPINEKLEAKIEILIKINEAELRSTNAHLDIIASFDKQIKELKQQRDELLEALKEVSDKSLIGVNGYWFTPNTMQNVVLAIAKVTK